MSKTTVDVILPEDVARYLQFLRTADTDSVQLPSYAVTLLENNGIIFRNHLNGLYSFTILGEQINTLLWQK